MNWKFTLAAISAGCFAVALGGKRAHAAQPAACKLLSMAQVSAVLGIKVDEDKSVSPSNNRVCQWDAPVVVGKARKGVALAFQSSSQGAANTTKPAGQVAKIPADGFRGDAYYMAMPEVGGVKVPKESSVLQIRVYGFPVDQIKTKEKILADCVFETLTNGRFQGGCPV
ncbi:MAG: hypothetical protein ACRD4S_08935 [Candidatus Acidiferrales bacterium]